MSLPLVYSLRNLKRRPWRTTMTVMGIAVVVFGAVLMLGLSRGLFKCLDLTGEPDNLLMISRKGQTTMFSNITRDEVVHLRSMPGLKKDSDGRQLISPEILYVTYVKAEEGVASWRAPISVHGVDPIAYAVHDRIRILSGRLPQNKHEALVGRMAHVKLNAPAELLAEGRTVRFEDQDWTIVGTFSDAGSLLESEIWVDQDDLLTVMRRRTHSLVVAKFDDPTSVQEAKGLFAKTGVIEKFFKGWSEPEYYAQYGEALSWVFWLSVSLVFMVGAAGILIGVNTMYTAIFTRMSEIATYRVLGFRKFDIAMSLLFESLVIAFIGGVVGSSAGLLINGIGFNLSQGAFNLIVDAPVILIGIGVSLLIGVAGGLLPVTKGLRMSIIRAMRHE